MKTVPVIELTHLTEAQKRAYVIADNRLALDAGWDEDLLAEELKALEGLDFNLELTGFDLDELHDLLEDETAEEVPAPEPPEDPVTRPGDLWVLGDHRLLCGDSSDPATVDRLLGGAPVHLVNTDPPYNVKVEPRSNNAIAAGLSSFPAAKSAVEASDARGMHHQGFDLARHKTKSRPTGRMRAKDRPLVNDFVSDEAFDQMLLAWFGNIARVLLPGRSFYIWGGYANCANYPPVLKATGLYFSQSIIWVKEHPVLTRKDFMGNHEWAFYGWREGARPPVLRAHQRRRRLGGQEGEPAEHGAPDRKAGGACGPGDPVLLPARRERAGPLRREREHADRLRGDRAAGIPHGARPRLHRRHRAPVAGGHGPAGRPRRGRPSLRGDRRGPQGRAGCVARGEGPETGADLPARVRPPAGDLERGRAPGGGLGPDLHRGREDRPRGGRPGVAGEHRPVEAPEPAHRPAEAGPDPGRAFGADGAGWPRGALDRSGYARARAAREVAQAQLVRLELEEKRGTLVRADEVRLGAFNMARKARDQLIALPERVSALLAATGDALEVQRILEEEIERICQEIADAERP